MKVQAFWKKLLQVLGTLTTPLLMLVVILCLLGALGNVENSSKEKNLEQVEDAVQKAVLNCYSIEGVYPPTLEYVEEHYGLQVDHARYDVFYEIFADNIMPEITVLPK